MNILDENEQKVVEQTNKISEIEYWPIEDLPSKFKLYPEGTKILGRKLKVLEVKKLANITTENYDSILESVLNATIKGIDIDMLNTADKLYIILWLRANSYREPGYSSDFYCSNCKKESTYDFDLDKLELKYLENFNPVIQLKNGDSLSYDFLRIKDEKNIKKFKETYKNIEIDDEVLKIAAMIKMLNNKQMSLIESYNYLTDKLDVENYAYLESEINKYDFGIKSIIKAKCNECKEETPIGVQFRSDFFIPKYTLR